VADRTRTTVKAITLGGAVILLSGAGWAAYSANLLRTSPPAAAVPAIPTGTAVVLRTDVRQETSVTGTLGHAGRYTLVAPPAQASAGNVVITWLPPVGASVTRGHPVYEVDGTPVPLFYGTRPAWRDLGLGVAGGPDVRQLKQNLVALGYGTDLVLNDTFDPATAWAVSRWQGASGLPVTGTVPLGEVAFLPGPLLVASQAAAVGAAMAAGTSILSGTGTRADVQVQLDPAVAPFIRPGDQVTVTLPDGSADPGTVTDVSRVAVAPAASGQQQGPPQPLIPADIRLTHPVRGQLDQAQVQVTITSADQPGALAVPITALLAWPGGQFVVVVVTPGGGHRTVPVRAGLFDQTAGTVAVTGPGLAAGQSVEVPSQ
jgi:peptidoglycan hydrolase-like protein with peptidoglycan-binding domain